MESKILSGTHTWEEAIAAQGGGWRLPSIFELLALCEETTEETIKGCWAASPFAGGAALAWGVILFNGNANAYLKTNNLCVRLVRGEPVECKPVCRRELVAYRLKQQNTKENKMKYKILGGPYTWKEAIDAQGDGWRLPNLFELKYLYSKNTEVRSANWFWSASPFAGSASLAWDVNFANGNDDVDSKARNYHVCLVRGDPAVQDPVSKGDVRKYKRQQKERQATLNAIDNTVECRDNEIKRLGREPKYKTTKKEQTMKLEVGKKYETKSGAVYKVIHILDAKYGRDYPVVAMEVWGGSIETFTIDGVYHIRSAQSHSNLIREYVKEPLISGYTKEQWKFIADGNFLCEFSDGETQKVRLRQTLNMLTPAEEGHEFTSAEGTLWCYCAPVSDVGHRQPWFGGEQPVASAIKILVKMRAGCIEFGIAKSFTWNHSGSNGDIVEFVYLGET